jgi:hypothetical protein
MSRDTRASSALSRRALRQVCMHATLQIKAARRQRRAQRLLLAVARLAAVGADRGAPAVHTSAPDAVMRADARAPAVLASAPLTVMLADACAPAVLALLPLAVMRADASPPQSLQMLLWRLCGQMLVPPQSLQMLLWRLCGQTLAPLSSSPPASRSSARWCCGAGGAKQRKVDASRGAGRVVFGPAVITLQQALTVNPSHHG